MSIPEPALPPQDQMRAEFEAAKQALIARGWADSPKEQGLHLTGTITWLSYTYLHIIADAASQAALSREQAARASVKPQECTCPSGDGSLRWPCPKHPPSKPQEQALPRSEPQEPSGGWPDYDRATWVAQAAQLIRDGGKLVRQSYNDTPEPSTEPCVVCNALIVPRNATHYDAEDLAAARIRGGLIARSLNTDEQITRGELPALPEPATSETGWDYGTPPKRVVESLFTADQMREYAILAIASARPAVGETSKQAELESMFSTDVINCVRTWGLPDGYLEAYMAGAARPASGESEPDSIEACLDDLLEAHKRWGGWSGTPDTVKHLRLMVAALGKQPDRSADQQGGTT